MLLSVAAWAEKADTTPRPVTLLFVGGSNGEAGTTTLQSLKARLEKVEAPADVVVVFTGNMLAAELPPSGEPGRAEGEAAVAAHVEAVGDFFARGGRVIFLPGHHELAGDGTKAVNRLRKLLNKSFATLLEVPEEEPQRAPEPDAGAPSEAVAGPGPKAKKEKAEKEVDVMPEAACGDSFDIEVTKNVILLLLNSQWWMQQTSYDPNFNDACSVKTRGAFMGNVADAMRKHRNHRLVIASHHPLRSYGEYGGSFTASAHWSPLPVVGTTWVLAREAGLVPQYQNHPDVQSFVSSVLSEGQRYGKFVFVGGHDASLQYEVVKRQVQLVAGTSASKGAPVDKANDGDFVAPLPGWVELAFEASGEGVAMLVGETGEALFTTQLPEVPGLTEEPPAEEIAPMPASPVLASYSTKPVWQLPGPVRFYTGSFYADAFALQLPYEVLDLSTEAGGMKPYKIGGGQQSNSFRVKDPRGGDWAVRSTTKDPSRLLPYPLNRLTPATRLLDHGFTATHPEAALAAPVLAEAMDVFHVHPRLMYLPDQEGLGEYRGFITDEVVVLEQRPKELKEGVPPDYLGGKDENTKYRDYDELVEKVMEKPSKNHVDQEAMLRARLLDIFVGDWDRHRGQWTFVGNTDESGDMVYRPIAMDRDQMFGNYDGLGLWVARMVAPQARSVQPFDAKYAPMTWLNYNARDVDAFMLNRLTHSRWMEIAHDMQAALTDEVIDRAMHTWHPEAFEQHGAFIADSLKRRRDGLIDAAEAFYRLRSRDVDVVGSQGDDKFEVTFADDGAVRVAVMKREGDKPWFERTFVPSETEEVRMYALDGDDRLEVKGKPHKKIGLRWVGGEGKDEVGAAEGTEQDPVWAKGIKVYDRENGVTIDPTVRVNQERSELARNNQYDHRENHEPDTGAFMPGLQINADQGVYLGGAFTWISQGWKKVPFEARHVVSAYFATATLGVALDYHGLFPRSLGVMDQQADVLIHTPQYTRNFYGFTNSYYGDNLPADFFRVRQALYEARYGLSYGFEGERRRVGIQAVGQGVVTEATQGRYVTGAPDVEPNELGARVFTGARIFAEINTFDSLTLPRSGVALHTSVEARFDPQHLSNFSTSHKIAAAVALPLDRAQRFVILTRAKLEGIVGDHPFYFAPTLGANELRAMHLQQLAGDLAFSHTTDLRVDVIRIRGMIPSTIGLNVSADHGRIWAKGVYSNDYHFNYGGGLWWSIVDLMGIQLSYMRGLDNEQRFVVAVGPLFAGTGF